MIMEIKPDIPHRNVSIDFFRGRTELLLIGDSTRLYSHIPHDAI